MAQSRPFIINDYPVIIGIDFGKNMFCISQVEKKAITFLFTLGTTFSGCSYAFAQNDEVVDIVRW
jgi:hypothetical protein